MNDKFRLEVRHAVNLYDVLGGDKQIIEEKLEDVVKVEQKSTDKKQTKAVHKIT